MGKDEEWRLMWKQMSYGLLGLWRVGLACEVNRLNSQRSQIQKRVSKGVVMRRSPSLRNNNGAVQVRVRLGGRDHFINRLGRWEDPLAAARAQVLNVRIWSDATAGSLDLSL